MRISADDAKIKRNALISRAIIIGSLVVIGALFVLSLPGMNFIPLETDTGQILYIGMIALMVIVFFVSRVGLVYANRYLSPFRPERVLREGLKGLDRKFALMIFRKPVDYYLLDPGGVTVFICRGQRGMATYKAGKWKRSGGGLSAFFASEEPLGDPFVDATEAMTRINAVLAEKAPSIKVPMQAVVVFTHADAKLDIEPSPIAVLRPGELKDYMRGAGKRRDLPTSVQRLVRAALDAPEIPAAEQS